MPRDWVAIDGTVASSIEYSTKSGPMYSVVFTYVVETHYFGGTFTTRTPYRSGDTIVLTYDPANPEANNLVRRERLLRWSYRVFFVLLAVLMLYLALRPEAGKTPLVP